MGASWHGTTSIGNFFNAKQRGRPMKRWMKCVFLLQIVAVLLNALQFIDAGQPALWIAGWLTGLPGNLLGQWIAEQWLWMKVSLRTVEAAGMIFAIVINLTLGWCIGRFVRYIGIAIVPKRSGAKQPLKSVNGNQSVG